MSRLRLLPALLLFALPACADAGDPEAADTDAAAVEAPATDAAPTPASAALLDPNDVGRETLMALPGMDDAAADALIAGRPYSDMLGVDAALTAHLDEGEREELYRHLWLPLDLNAASGEEMLLIPGVGERMRHEFEEYRPYRAIEQFRREIGKYVDEQEVARLERYVTIR